MSKLMKCLILSLLLVGTGFAAKSWTLKSGSDGMIHDWATPDKASTNEDPKYTGKPLDVNGTWEAWNFMKKHSLNGAIATIPSHRDSIYNGDFMEGSAAWNL